MEILLALVLAFAQAGACAPTSSTSDGQGPFFVKVSADCPAASYPRAEDVPQFVSDTGAAPDGYVLAADLKRDDDNAELLVLVKPWSLNNYIAALAIAKLIHDGDMDGHTWNWALTDPERS